MRCRWAEGLVVAPNVYWVCLNHLLPPAGLALPLHRGRR